MVLPVIVVKPAPETALDKVPPVNIKSPALVTAPPIFPAFAVKSPEEEIEIV